MTLTRRRVMVVGGYGVFGGRLVGSLATTPWADVVVAGRSLTKAQAFVECVRQRHPKATITSAEIDVSTDCAQELRQAAPWLVINAAGPFQGAGYAFPIAVIEAGAHYIDLADDRDFVCGFDVLNQQALARNVVAISGASSAPALTDAATAMLTKGWRRVDTVEIALSLASRSDRGPAIIAAGLDYAGKPIRLLRDGRWCTVPGWSGPRRMALPGLGRRWLSFYETPDLDLLVRRFRPQRSSIFRAGRELAPLHLGMTLLSLLVRWRVMSSARWLARPLTWLDRACMWFGSDRGGMQVRATGLDAAGQQAVSTWSLVAADGDGPQVPTLPALALARLLAWDRIDWRGARACVGLLTLDEIVAEMRPFVITTTLERNVGPTECLFREVIGSDFDRLPAAVARMHQPEGWLVASGQGEVAAGDTATARLIAWLFRFPPPADDVPVTVTFDATPGRECWTRWFGRHRFSSLLTALPRHPGHAVERFGPFSFRLALSVDDTGLEMRFRGWRFLGLPLPRWLGPRVLARETADAEGRFRFDIALSHPLLGRVVGYRGWLRPQVPDAQTAV